MRRVAGAGLLIVILGGGHIAGLFPERSIAPPPAPLTERTPEARPAGVRSAAARAAGLPGAYHEDPLRFLSTASSDSLELLPGIGPVLAARIVADRDARGPFTTWTELDRVRGIGPVTVRRLEAAARRR